MALPLSNHGLDHFDALARQHVGDDDAPGLVAVVASGDQVHVTTVGTLGFGRGPMQRSTRFRIASTTKTIACVAAMTLVDEGAIGLDDPVERWLPELTNRRVLRHIDGPLDDTVPAERPITVRDLLTFRCGFGMAAEQFTAVEEWPIVAATHDLHPGLSGSFSSDEATGSDAWIAKFGMLPLMAQPGRRWLYHVSALILGVLLERVTGRPLSDVLDQRVFAPLGMDSTCFQSDDADRLATSYERTPNGLVEWDAPSGRWSRTPRFLDAAAGLLSTADDLLAFSDAFLMHPSPILSADAVEQMTTDQLTAAQRSDAAAFLDGKGWGLGQAVVLDGPRTGSFGWDGGLGTSWIVDPHRDLVVIVLTQWMFDSAQLPAVHTDLQGAAYAALA